MIVDHQTEARAFMQSPATHGLAQPVETIETHISQVFLAGDRAYKLKRAVKLPYVDFSTPGLRLAACEKEVALNMLTAPSLYLGVRRITRERDGSLAFDGGGEMVDAVVEMVRFDQASLFDQMAAEGALGARQMTEVARMVARFHRQVPVVHAGGGADNLAGVLSINEAGFGTSSVFGAAELAPFNAAFRKALSRHAALLDRREAAGKVRRCHGDLHLRNIFLMDGEPTLFDCIEFNDQIATVDTLYDLAFLLMDLWHRGLGEFANLVMNRYLDETDDEDGFVLLPFLMAIRAAVRAHVTATQVEEADERSRELIRVARSYFELARALLAEAPARLVAIGGVSGSGKTTVAEALAPHVGPPPGARIVESDRIRKAMHGVPPETRLPPKAYRPEVSDRVYREMAWRAGVILGEGGSVVADAVFDREQNREMIEVTARSAGVPFDGIWLEADPALLWKRVAERTGGSSDATVDVLSLQLGRDIGHVSWRRIDAAAGKEEIVEEILEGLRPQEDAGKPPRAAS